MAIPLPEITAVAKVLARDHMAEYMSEWHAPLVFSPPTERDVAKLCLEAAEEKRQAQAKFISVGRIQLPNGEWHHFALGPYSTLAQSQKAGEAFTHDPRSGTGTGQHRAVPVVNNAKEAYDRIRPEQADHKAWLREQIETGLTGLSDPDVYKERGKW